MAHFTLESEVILNTNIIWTASSEFGTYRLCEQRRFRRACASAQSPQNLRCSLIQAVSQEEPSDRKPDPWPLWMAGHAQLKFVMTECSKTQIRLTGPISWTKISALVISFQNCWQNYHFTFVFPNMMYLFKLTWICSDFLMVIIILHVKSYNIFSCI